MPELVPLILAGGSGTRLWPLSRKLFPKQFQCLTGEHSMLQQTVLRIAGLRHTAPVVVCSEEHRFLVAEQCRAIDADPAAIILEPVPRNTAPAIALGAFKALELAEDPLLLVLPSDHYIEREAEFRDIISRALSMPENGLMTFGIVPSRPHSGYGYIERGEPLAGEQGISQVAAFMEKPALERAAELVADGLHYWNSGMFLFRARTYLAELEQHRPDIYAACQLAYAEGRADMDFFRPAASFADSPSDSIDYAVMEKTRNALVIPADIGWNDLGSWSALWEVMPQDANGNSLVGDVVDADSRNSFVHAGHRLVATIGLQDAVVVETRDAVLVAQKDRVQDVKELVANLKSRARIEHEAHVQVFRPWGSYQGLESGPGFQVKRITVNPGATLSLQMHNHRSEHWIVVSGTATVVRGDEEFTLNANQSTYIPLETRHRLTNHGDELLELIEVQVGSYLGEDDIVRYDDRYGRVGDGAATAKN